MKGTDVMATKIGMPLGTERANLLQTASVASEGLKMSFAKSFGEVTAGVAGPMPVGQMMKGNAPLLAKNEATSGSMEKLLNVSVGDGLKEVSTPASTTVAKSNTTAAKGESLPAHDSEKSGSLSQATVVVGNAGTQLQSAGTDISDNAPVNVSNEKLSGPMGEAVGNQERAGAKIDSVTLPLGSKVAQTFVVGGEGRSVVQKGSVAVTAGKPEVKKTAEREVKGKGDSSVVVSSLKNVSAPVEVSITQMTVTVPVGAVPLVEVKTQSGNSSAERDASAGTASRQVIGVVGAKAVKSSPYGVDRGAVGKSVLSASKEGPTDAAKVSDGVVRTKKDEAGSLEKIATVNKAVEGATHGGGAVADLAAHGVLDMTRTVTGDAVFAKARMDGNSVDTAVGQNMVNSGATSVGDGHRTLEATPTTLEVGVTNGTHGWLKIRAEMADGGVVNASVSATTTAGQEMLHRELPSLTAYLHGEQISVGSVVVHATAAGSREFGGMESDAGREQMQQRQEGERNSGTASSENGDGYFRGGLNGTGEVEEIAARAVYNCGGSWLSVRA